METITKIIRAEDKFKTLDIPAEFADKDVKVTFEPLKEETNLFVKEKISELNELYKLAREKNIKIPEGMDVDKIMNEMNDDLL